MRSATLLSLSVFLLFGCSRESDLPPAPVVNEDSVKEQFVEANRMLAMREDEQMDMYARNHRMPFVRTPSGIRFFVYRSSAQGDSIRPGLPVTMDYTLSLLDGTVCYTSDSLGRRTFVVGQDNVESGLHRGIQNLRTGDKAFIMIPSSQAHGLLGDLKKIPPHMPIVYHVWIHSTGG